MPAVLILAVNPVGCDLKPLSSKKHRHRPMLNARIKCLRKQLLNLLRHRRSCNVPVPRLPSKNRIPDTSAHRIGLKSRRLYRINDNIHFFR